MFVASEMRYCGDCQKVSPHTRKEGGWRCLVCHWAKNLRRELREAHPEIHPDLETTNDTDKEC